MQQIEKKHEYLWTITTTFLLREGGVDGFLPGPVILWLQTLIEICLVCYLEGMLRGTTNSVLSVAQQCLPAVSVVTVHK